jgi:hypothetical protein
LHCERSTKWFHGCNDAIFFFLKLDFFFTVESGQDIFFDPTVKKLMEKALSIYVALEG